MQCTLFYFILFIMLFVSMYSFLVRYRIFAVFPYYVCRYVNLFTQLYHLLLSFYSHLLVVIYYYRIFLISCSNLSLILCMYCPLFLPYYVFCIRIRRSFNLKSFCHIYRLMYCYQSLSIVTSFQFLSLSTLRMKYFFNFVSYFVYYYFCVIYYPYFYYSVSIFFFLSIIFYYLITFASFSYFTINFLYINIA